MRTKDQVIREAMALSAEERLEVAERLFESVEGEIDPAELARLVAEGRAEADRGELEDAEGVFERIRAESERRRAGK
jgi:hypothetical protein